MGVASVKGTLILWITMLMIVVEVILPTLNRNTILILNKYFTKKKTLRIYYRISDILKHVKFTSVCTVHDSRENEYFFVCIIFTTTKRKKDICRPSKLVSQS